MFLLTFSLLCVFTVLIEEILKFISKWMFYYGYYIFTYKYIFSLWNAPFFFKASCVYFMDLVNFLIFLRILTILICFLPVSLYCLFLLSCFFKFLGFVFSHSCKILSSKLCEWSQLSLHNWEWGFKDSLASLF